MASVAGSSCNAGTLDGVLELACNVDGSSVNIALYWSMSSSIPNDELSLGFPPGNGRTGSFLPTAPPPMTATPPGPMGIGTAAVPPPTTPLPLPAALGWEAGDGRVGACGPNPP